MNAYDASVDDEDQIEDYEPPEGFSEHELGCDFPDECLMPGEHMRSECHTVEMLKGQKQLMLGERLGFQLIERSGAPVLEFPSGVCRRASPEEVVLWNALWAAT